MTPAPIRARILLVEDDPVQARLYQQAFPECQFQWVRSASEPLPVKVIIYTDDRPGILNQVTSILNTESSNIRSLEARGDTSRRDEAAIVDITMEVRDKKQLDRVITAFRRIPGVRDIERIQQAP